MWDRNSLGQYLGSKLNSKLTVFKIEVWLTGSEIKIGIEVEIEVNVIWDRNLADRNWQELRPLYYTYTHKQNADSTYNLRIPCIICGFCLQLRIPQQLNLMIQMFYHMFVDSTSCSGFRKYSCGFRKFAYFSRDFERYNDLGICLWNQKQHRRSKKSSNVADFATNLILACCGFHIQSRECTVWPRNILKSFLLIFFRFSSEFSS